MVGAEGDRCCAITFGLFCATGVLIDQFINTQELEDCLVLGCNYCCLQFQRINW